MTGHLLDVKTNFRAKYRDELCRGCGKEKETQQHVLEKCTVIHEGCDQIVEGTDIFTDDVTKLKEAAERIETIMALIDKSERQDTQHTTGKNAQPGNLGQHST